MPPKVNESIESLIAALSNERVVEAFSKMLQPMLACLTDDFSKRFDELKSEINKLTAELHSRETQIAELKIDNTRLNSRIQQHETRIDALEAYTRVDNLVICGLPETYANIACCIQHFSVDR